MRAHQHPLQGEHHLLQYLCRGGCVMYILCMCVCVCLTEGEGGQWGAPGQPVDGLLVVGGGDLRRPTGGGRESRQEGSRSSKRCILLPKGS